jgi:hypothetical protein
MKQPTLFLGIDGVLLPGSYIDKRPSYHALHPDCCRLLNGWLLEVKPDIVIISRPWQQAMTLEGLQQHLKNYGIIHPLHSYLTPDLPDSPIPKGLEISKWIADQVLQGGPERSYVILDDDSGDKLQSLAWYLVKTDHALGLQPQHLEAMDKILKEQQNAS